VPGVEFIRGVEVQDGKHRADGVGRGALHDHAIIDSPVPLPEKRWKPEMRRRAVAAGYGHSLDFSPVVAGSKRAAYYISKYITKACDVRDSVPWWGEVIDYRTGEVTEGLCPGRYRTWSSSRSWGMTMADARAVCREFVQRRQAVEHDALLAFLEKTLGAVEVPEPVPI